MRLLILSDANETETAALIRATLVYAARRPAIEVCGIVTTRLEAFQPTWSAVARRAARRALIAGTTRRMPYAAGEPFGHEVRRCASRHGVPLVVPPAGDLHDPAFIARVVRDLRPDAAVSYYCLKVLRRPLLDALGGVVNFHDGCLPAYRGCSATAFSLYAGEHETGFAFHRMDEGLDTGPVLVQGAVAVDTRASLAQIVRAKTRAAVAALPRALEMLADGAPGKTQAGEPGYFSGAQGRAARRIAEPQEVTARELYLRVWAFGQVEIAIDGAMMPVTRLRRSAPGRPMAFRTADGEVLAPDRLVGLPCRLQGRRELAR